MMAGLAPSSSIWCGDSRKVSARSAVSRRCSSFEGEVAPSEQQGDGQGCSGSGTAAPLPPGSCVAWRYLPPASGGTSFLEPLPSGWLRASGRTGLQWFRECSPPTARLLRRLAVPPPQAGGLQFWNLSLQGGSERSKETDRVAVDQGLKPPYRRPRSSACGTFPPQAGGLHFWNLSLQGEVAGKLMLAGRRGLHGAPCAARTRTRTADHTRSLHRAHGRTSLEVSSIGTSALGCWLSVDHRWWRAGAPRRPQPPGGHRGEPSVDVQLQAATCCALRFSGSSTAESSRNVEPPGHVFPGQSATTGSTPRCSSSRPWAC